MGGAMSWQQMSMDEFAQYRSEEGMKLVQIDGIWWAEVRPCFYRPLFPFCEIKPWSRSYPRKSVFGGFMHAVPPSTKTSTCLNCHVYDDLPDYSLDLLSSNRRRLTRRSIERFNHKQITDIEEFVDEGHEIYCDFYSRTNYWYMKGRSLKDNFRAWAANLFAFPQIHKTGFYLDGKLVAIETSFRIDDIIFADNLFSNDVGLKANVVDYVQHTLRELAAQTDAKYLFLGFPTGKKSLDSSKLEKGCKVLKVPAYCKFNPIALYAAKFIMTDSYNKLLTVIEGNSES
jgi:hypothetical protein